MKKNNRAKVHGYHPPLCAKQSASKYIKQQLTELKGETNKLIIVAKILPKPQKLIYQENNNHNKKKNEQRYQGYEQLN